MLWPVTAQESASLIIIKQLNIALHHMTERFAGKHKGKFNLGTMSLNSRSGLRHF